MSLAPSPTAMVRANGTPAAAANEASAVAFPARSTMVPSSSPVTTPPSSDEDVGRQVVDAEVGHQRSDHLGEPPAHHGQLVAEPLQRAHQRTGAGGEQDAVAHGLEVRLLQAGQEAHPPAQRVGELDLTRHGGLRDRGHLAAAAAALGQQVDHLALQQGGVRVQDDEMLRPALQPGPLHREIDLAAGRRLGQGAPQAVDIGPGDGQLVAVHRIGRQAHDPLDVAATPRDAARHRLEGGGVDLRRQQRDQMALGRAPSPSPSPAPPPRGARRVTSTPASPKRCARTARTGSTSDGTMSASTQSSSRPWTRTCSTSSTSTLRSASAPNNLSAMPGPSCPLTVTRIRRARRGHDRDTSFSVTQPAPSTHRLTIRAGTPATTQRSGTSPRTTAPGGHHDVLADLRPRQDDRVGAEPAARADANRGFGRPLAPYRLDRVLVGMVLIRDVDVRPGLDVVADHDLPVADDVRAATDQAAAADGDDRVARHLLSRCHAGRDGDARTDDRLGARRGSGVRCRWRPGGTAGRRRHPSFRSAAPGGRRVRSLRARRRRPRPRAPTGITAAAAVRGGNGPSSRWNGRCCRRQVEKALTRLQRGRVGKLHPCSPCRQTAAPVQCRSRPSAPSTVGSSCSSLPSAPSGSPAPPTWTSAPRSACRPGAKRRTSPTAGGRRRAACRAASPCRRHRGSSPRTPEPAR